MEVYIFLSWDKILSVDIEIFFCRIVYKCIKLFEFFLVWVNNYIRYFNIFVNNWNVK